MRVNFINAGLDMEMPGEPAPGGGGFIPIVLRFRIPSPPPPPARGRGRHDGHVPRPLSRGAAPPRFDMGDFGGMLDPKKMPDALKDGT